MKIGMHNGSPIYIQEKADIIGLSSTSPSPESKSRFTNSFADRLVSMMNFLAPFF